jgi:hypothetical protein
MTTSGLLLPMTRYILSPETRKPAAFARRVSEGRHENKLSCVKYNHKLGDACVNLLCWHNVSFSEAG